MSTWYQAAISGPYENRREGRYYWTITDMNSLATVRAGWCPDWPTANERAAAERDRLTQDQS